MELTDGIWRWAARVGQMLTLLATLFLAVNPLPLHAQVDDGAGHSHFGSFCETLDTDMSPSGGTDGPQGSHGDCMHHFVPMVRAPVEHADISGSAAEARPHVDPARQPVLTSDPPPPRYPS